MLSAIVCFFFFFFFRKPDADEQTLDMLVVKVSKLQSHRTIRLGSALQGNELQDKTVQLPFCAGALAAHASRQAPQASELSRVGQGLDMYNSYVASG